MMDNTNNFRGRQERKFDKTLDENKENLRPMPESYGTGIVNPYTQTGAKATPLTGGSSPVSVLPDGTQPLPLGSGIITGLLGEGGMARVYRIWNDKLEMYRAVKVLLPTERPELMERFETEIKISAKLHHPNIVETYTVGEWDGLPFIEMELVEGVSLDYLIRQYEKVPMEVCAAVGIQVARALSYAHNQQFLIYGKTYNGIIHRDLKPANVMIGKDGVVKLMDFGIARPTEVGLHTVAGNIVGTLPYLSPEQLDESDIDHRSDIYSLGTILYESLTGEKTFPQATVTNLMRMKIINSYRKFESFSLDISPQLAKAVEKCLSQNKNDRFATAADLAKALEVVFDHFSSESLSTIIKEYLDDPVAFVSSHSKKRFRGGKFVKPAIITGAAVATVALVVGLLIAFPPPKPDGNTVQPVATVTVPVMPPVVQPIVNTQVVIHDTIERTVNQANVTVNPPVKPPVRIITTPKHPDIVADARPVESLVALLVKKYSENDMVSIAEAACKVSQYSDAITAIENMPSDHPKKLKGNILLAYAYLETNKVSKALSIAEGINSEDAFLTLINGRIALAQSKDKSALDNFELALTRPSDIRSAQAIRNDALYYTALTYDSRFTATRSPEARQQALMAWNTLKRMYVSQPDNPRFKLANQKLASF